jgi:hypothetical protein
MKTIIATVAASVFFAALFIVSAYETLFAGKSANAQEDDL